MEFSSLTDYRTPINALHRVAWLVASAVFTLSLLLIIFLGSHSRLMSDDFCHLTAGLEYGPWQSVLHWRNSNSGSYSYYFLHGLVAPLDFLAPSVFVVIIVGTWLFGLVWLIVAGHRLLGQTSPPLAIVILIAAALVSYSIHGMLSNSSIYWYSAAARHTLPIAMLLTVLAACCAFAPRLRSKLRLAVACAMFALVSFTLAGASEVFAVLQLVILTLLLPVVYAINSPMARRNSLALNICGWAATVTSLLVILTAPGVARRLTTIDTSIGLALNDPVNLLPKVLSRFHTIFRDTELIAGFIGTLMLCLFLVLAFQRPAKASPVRQPFQLARSPLLLCLLVQLLLLPLVWTNQSDNPLVFGRFSPAYTTVVGAHMLLLTGLAAVLLARRRINVCLQSKPEYWAAIPISALTVILIIFGLSQFRSINSRAETFVSCNIFVLLLALLWQFYIHFLASGRKMRFLAAVIWVFIAKWLCIIVLVAVHVAIFGRLILYSLPFVSFAFVFSGFFCGFSLAFAISQVNASTPAMRAMQLLARGCAIVAIALGLSWLTNNAKNIPSFEQFSHAWDQRHQLVLNKLESGDTLTELPRLAMPIPGNLGYFPNDDYWLGQCASSDITALLEKRYRA